MKKILLFLLLIPQLAFGVNPSFQSFDTTDFGTTNNAITIKSNKWATISYLTNKVTQTGIATNVALATHALYSTNTVPGLSPVTVSEAAEFTQVNATYNLWISNVVNGVTRYVYTNNINTAKIEYRSDQDNGLSNWSIEPSTNNFASGYYYAILVDNNGYPSGAAFSVLGDSGTVVSSPVDVVTPFQVAEFSGAYLRKSSSATNIVVDKWVGNDTFANRTNGIPFASVQGACAFAIAGDTINMVSANYASLGNITPAKGVIINGNYSTINGTLFIVDNNRIYNLVSSVQPSVTVTNADSVTIVENFRVVNSTDYMIVNDVNGLFQLINPINVGYWDGIILHKMRTTGIFQIFNPQFAQVWGNNTAVTWGMHGIGWQIRSGEGGKLQIFGGSIAVLNSTNLTFSTLEGLAGNSCILITDAGGGTTNYGNASLEIYGTTLIHGSTNASVIVSGLSNVLGIPIVGTYKDAVGGAGLFSPVTLESTVIKGNTSVAGRFTNLNATASTVGYFDAAKVLVSSATTPTELGYLHGVTSDIQTQFTGKLTSPLTTKGDILTYAAAPARLGVGANGKVLASDSTKSTGLDWINVLTSPLSGNLDAGGFDISGIGLLSGTAINISGGVDIGTSLTVGTGITFNAFVGGGSRLLTVDTDGVVGATTDLSGLGDLVVDTLSANDVTTGNLEVIAAATFDANARFLGSTVIDTGATLMVREGSNAVMGHSTLGAGGTVTVSNTRVTANSEIFLTCRSAGGTRGVPGITAMSAGTSFTITSTSASDTSVISWIIIEPAP